jgi:hypothetical protein
LKELEKELSGLKVIPAATCVVVSVGLILLCSYLQSVIVHDSNTFPSHVHVGLLKGNASTEQGVKSRGEVKFSINHRGEAFAGQASKNELGTAQQPPTRLNHGAARSPSRVMEALGRDLMQDLRLNQLEETPDSLNRRGQPGVIRMKHGAQVGAVMKRRYAC